MEYILYNICSKLVGLIRWNSLFNVINYNIGLADKPWIPNWGEVRWNFIKFVKKGVEKRGKEAKELKGAEDKNFAWENFDHSKSLSCYRQYSVNID